MADFYTLHPATADDSEATVENIIEMMMQTQELAADQMGNFERTIRRLKKKINQDQEKLRLLLAENNIDATIPQFSQVLGDDIYPDSESEPAQTYLNPGDASTKKISVMELYTLKEISNHEPGMNDAIREAIDRIYKTKNMLSKVTYKLEKFQNIYGDSIDKKSSSPSYTSAKKKNKLIALLIMEVRSFRDVIVQIPEELSSEAMQRNLNTNMHVFCSAYVVRKKQMIKDAVKFQEDYEEDNEEIADSLPLIIDKMETFPTQYTGVIPYKKDYTTVADDILAELGVLLASSMSALYVLAGSQGFPNEKIDSLRRNVISVLRSKAKQSVVTRLTREQMLLENEDKLNRKKERADKFVNSLNRIGQAVTEGAEVVSGMFGEFSKRLYNKAVLSSGFPGEFTKDGEDTLKDNQREIVRQRYGGQIPFCDEVVVEHPDGSREFVKKDEATEIEEGVWMKTSDLKADQYMRTVGRNPLDTNR